MRHAKSSWEDDLEDHQRRLTDRGRRDARRMAERLVDVGWVPERVLCSDATRTVETWERMAERLPPGIELLLTGRLYHAGPDRFSEVVSEQPDEMRSLLVLGHNPGWEEVVRRLTGLPVGLNTAAAALLQREGGDPWRSAMGAHEWRLVDVLRPKDPLEA
jgi:phosphohistidine phosphatase